MSKDAPGTPTSPQLLVPPGTNLPFHGMGGYPFPVLHPPMGQFIPMGMLPIDANHYMELATKRGFHPAMMTPMFATPNMLLNPTGVKLMDDVGNSSSNTANQTQSMEQASGNNVPITQSSSGIHPLSANKTEPVMPMPPMFFLPFAPAAGVAGYFPNYPNFNVIPPSTNGIEIPKDDSKLVPSEKDVLPRSLQEDKHLEELDVAKILVDMQVPVLKQVKSSVATARCSQDSTSEAIDMSNPIAGSQDVIMSSSAPTTSQDSDVKRPASPFNAPSSFEHSGEQLQNDEQQGETSSNKLESEEVDQQASEELELEYPSDPNGEIRPAEVQLQNVTLEETSEVKLEVIGEGESTLQAQSMDITGLEQTTGLEQQPASSNVEIVAMPPHNPSEETPQKPDEGLLELKSIKNEVMDISPDENPVAELSSEESSKHLTPDVIEESSEQIIADSDSKNTLKQQSPEERKEQDELEKNNFNYNITTDGDAGTDENGVPKKGYKCDVCSQLFRSPLGLQKHIEFHMDDGKHYTCSICFMHFCNDDALQEHHEKHTRKRPHKCEFCPKAFRDPGSLQKHVRVHTGEKPYKCKDCPRSFAEYSSLRKHQRVHTGEQPYKCQYCSKAFSISGNLQRHILIHTGERPYKCNFCTKAFNNPSHLRRHVKNLHFKGDSAIDEAMLSHYGNPAAAAKNAEQESSPEVKGEEAMKQEAEQSNGIETSPLVTAVSADDLESVPRTVVLQAL